MAFEALRANGSALVAKLRDRYEALSPRERLLLNGLAVLLPVTVVVLIIYSVASTLSELEETVASRHDTLTRIAEKRADYREQKAEADKLRTRVEMISRQLKLFEFIEQKARDNGITLTDIKDRGEAKGPQGSLIKEKLVDVRVEKIKQNTLSKFLYDIESAPYMLKVRTLNIRARNEAERTLDVNFTLASYVAGEDPTAKPAGAGAGGAPAKPTRPTRVTPGARPSAP